MNYKSVFPVCAILAVSALLSVTALAEGVKIRCKGNATEDRQAFKKTMIVDEGEWAILGETDNYVFRVLQSSGNGGPFYRAQFMNLEVSDKLSTPSFSIQGSSEGRVRLHVELQGDSSKIKNLINFTCWQVGSRD